MKKIITYAIVIIGLATIIGITFSQKTEKEKLQEKHASFLANSPFTKYKGLTKKDRKALGLPPNAYNDQIQELEIDPNTGKTHPERVFELQQQLRTEKTLRRDAGGSGTTNPWVERGPNNIGGRTRAIMFDPNDAEKDRVFAGGVSGGLWVNEDITNANSSWTQVSGLGANIQVTCIIADPNNSQTFYLGSGESYGSGSVIGNGIWKSTNKGVTWTHIFGGLTSTTGQHINGVFYINDIVARNNGGSTELFASIAGAFYGSSPTTNQFHGLSDQGLYKSTDNGANWNRITLANEASGGQPNPNDLELDVNNNVWLTTTSSSFGDAGGKILKSTDGATFTLMQTIANAARTELEPHPTDANRFWVAIANTTNNNQVDLFTTTNAFATAPTAMTEPGAVGSDTPATDYTRNQAFWNLPIEADASGNLYVGGINLHKTTDNGANWTLLSKWTANGFNMDALNVPVVHADQHAIVFRPGTGNGNKIVFGNDGGVAYTDDITTLNATTITPRNKNYNVTQFYYGTIDQTGAANGDDIAGGAQDNGTLMSVNTPANQTNGYSETNSGDGGFTEIDAADGYMIDSYTNNSHEYRAYPGNFPNYTQGTVIASKVAQAGSFINEAALDTNLDILYSNATLGTTYEIERNSNFKVNPANVVRASLTNALLDQAPTAFKVSPFTTGSTKLYVGLKNGKLLRLDNANATPTWADISNGDLTGSISDIELGATENDIFVTMHNYGVSNIWYSSNGGTSWTAKDGNLADMPVKCILKNPLLPNEVIIGTYIGVWGTSDISVASPVWVQLKTGMSETPVTDLDLRTSDNTILATTFGRGFFTGKFTAVPLSISDENIKNQKVSIYPNPASSEINIGNDNSFSGKVTFSIFDTSGKVIKKGNLLNHKINVQTLKSGLYLVTINSENKSYVGKFLKK